ncbi:MAG: phenylalanine--tRNA ligase subunit beta [Pirellulaceae bacterium]|nr:phenylalanine--tRNA ligase subunit beta [Pirellulaceae bacterium]
MLVSWNWLREYVDLKMSPGELAERLSMAGLNHEETRQLGDDVAIDLEITSNRPDCLGHLGVAREVAVLWRQPLRVPDPRPAQAATRVGDVTRVTIECPELCRRYTARVIRGARIGPSPPWLANRLRTVGIGVVNNVVDVTNYVMLECGQPLHAFDLARLRGPEIIVRQARAGEVFQAIDHRQYTLEPGMCVIADAGRAVGLGGVMGGVDSEVSAGTTELLIEAADFAPLAIRNTARRLNLHSPSSYRFERGVDPRGVEWASRRCCELILQLAGGELLEGVIDQGRPLAEPPLVRLRLAQIGRILGVDVPRSEVERILTALGGQLEPADDEAVTLRAPSWRADLTREIDLIEEVARIHGYDAIPEDVGVPMAPSHRTDEDRVLAKVRQVLTAAGFDEAMTISMVPEEWSDAFSPWTDLPPLVCNAAMLKGADRLRRSLIPSLLEARRVNESLANDEIELFETAHIYLPQPAGSPGQPRQPTSSPDAPRQPAGLPEEPRQPAGLPEEPRQPAGLPDEQWTLGLTSGRGFAAVKGVVEQLVGLLTRDGRLAAEADAQPLLDGERSCRLLLDGQLLGFLGELSRDGQRRFGLRQPATVLELNLRALARRARLIPQQQELSPYPAMVRDLNLIVSEGLAWSELEQTVLSSAGPCLEALRYLETYRDPQRDGRGKKRLLLSLALRSAERTLTGDEADAIRDQVVQACAQRHAATLL